MFYSHEVLTSRKYGVATVWLVATLGSKSSFKKINRKQILDVDVPKACRTIVDPVAPMALRLQGNLLYGVSRVYLQQCGYVLSDTQNAHNSMQMMLRTGKSAVLDPEAGKARPEQLILPDDPSFLPEFAMPPSELLADLELNIGFEARPASDSQSLTPFGTQQRQSSRASSVGGLVLPSSSSDAPGGFVLAGDDHSGSIGLVDDTGDIPNILDFADEPDFDFDMDGNIVNFTPRNILSGTPAPPRGSTMLSDTGASDRVRLEHEEGQRATTQIPFDQMDLDLPAYGDDLPEGEAFPVRSSQPPEEQAEVIGSTSTSSAPLRQKKRSKHTLAADREIGLRNTVLADWNANYPQNMDEASRQKTQKLASALAKKKAEYYVWGTGMGGIGHGLPGGLVAAPFNQFIGENFFELYTGVNRKALAGKKHDRDSGIDEATQNESRHVRQKTGEPEDAIGIGFDDDGMFMPGGNDIEFPREAPSALDDHQMFSTMPWNMSASARGSSAIPRSSRLRTMGSVDQGRPLGRMVSASPLHGRGQPGGLEALQALDSDGDLRDLIGDFGDPAPSSDGIEPAAISRTSTRVHGALSSEGENFLTFVSEAIAEKRNLRLADLHTMSDPLQIEIAYNINDVSIEELLPPTETNTVIASQALMMLLSLGTKGLLDVRQDEAFGEISVRLSELGKASQIIEIPGDNSGEEGDQSEKASDEDENGDDVEENGDDHDSLYAD